MRDLRQIMKRMPARVPPAELGIRLRILASQELERRRIRNSWPARLARWRHSLRLRADNLMRPLAIPTAGGFVSALLLFGALAPSLAVPGITASARDIPTILYTEPSVKRFVPLDSAQHDLIVEITLDGNGRVVDYSIPNGEHTMSPHQRRAIENHLLFAEFTPATRFFQPTGGKLRISFLSSRIDVKG